MLHWGAKLKFPASYSNLEQPLQSAILVHQQRISRALSVTSCFSQTLIRPRWTSVTVAVSYAVVTTTIRLVFCGYYCQTTPSVSELFDDADEQSNDIKQCLLFLYVCLCFIFILLSQYGVSLSY